MDTVIIPSQSSNSDRDENDGLQVEGVNRDIGGDLADGVVDLPGSRSVQYQGYSYSYYHGDVTKHYRCSAYRRTKCNVKLYVSQLGAVMQGSHKPIFVTKHFGRDIFGRLEMEPLCDVKNSAGLKFFQFHYAYYEDEVLQRIIGWTHPQLMDPIKQRHCSIFIDATYRCVPIRFYQLVILMLYDPISDLYLPIWYAGKTSQVYEHLLHSIFVSSKKKLAPAHVVRDFEYALIKVVKTQFPDSTIVGCLFHFKQALRRKMLKLKITEAEVNLAMIDGCIDRLTVIRRLDIVFRGIPDVRRMIKRSCGYQGIQYSKDKWTKFWKYFKTTWIKKIVPAWWNTNGLGKDIVNRTNNPLERYNRTLNDAFSVAHPDVTLFISVIEAQSREYV
ncbi:hypothetical protein AM588_10002807 [Phytophthora nicotianae]|uniref:Uncharacterized protein n=1 Tax=Phytophthora nicotianae TaxID=4792 RepID=A0A0W8D1M4_PHYNI|nr:hypothetical protein AM588_10002807 [Phytophthora nicotianae]